MVGANGGGANNVPGEVFVFDESASGWQLVQTLRPTDSYLGDQFSYQVILSEDAAFIGGDIAGAPGASGAVYAFVHGQNGWLESQKLKASNLSGSAYFGAAMDRAGGLLLIGALGQRTPSAATGAVYVYQQVGSGWVESAELIPSNGQHLDYFGGTVVLSGAEAFIGAFGHDTLGPASNNTFDGAVYVFSSGPGGWTETQILRASDAAPFDAFGLSVAMGDEKLFVSAPGANNARGAIYWFERNGGLWVERGKLRTTGLDPFDNLGRSLSFGGGYLAAGAPFDDVTAMDSGSVYVFEPIPIPELATVVGRRAPGNPNSYSAGPAMLGLSWKASVDLELSGHTHASVEGYFSPTRLPRPGGRTLLVDLDSPRVFRLSPVPAIDGTASWRLRLPDLPALSGLTVYTQALLFSPTLPYALSNAQDLRLGY